MEDTVRRQDAIEALELTTWYHQNRNGEMVKGANSKEHQAWYKAEDVYAVLHDLPSAEPEIVRCKDCKYWREHKYAKETKRYIPFCGFNAIYTKADDFCSKGTRRTE